MSGVEPSSSVVDAPVACAWFAEVRHSEQAVALLDAQPAAGLLAPDLVLAPLLNCRLESAAAGGDHQVAIQGDLHGLQQIGVGSEW